MAALDARHVHETCGTADQSSAWKGEARDCLPAAFGERPRAIGDAPAALQMLGDARMQLGALKLLERVEVGIGVVEMHDEADRHQVVAEMIEEGAAAFFYPERPAHRVLPLPRPGFSQ